MVMILITVAGSYWESCNLYQILKQMKTATFPKLVGQFCWQELNWNNPITDPGR